MTYVMCQLLHCAHALAKHDADAGCAGAMRPAETGKLTRLCLQWLYEQGAARTHTPNIGCGPDRVRALREGLEPLHPRSACTTIAERQGCIMSYSREAAIMLDCPGARCINQGAPLPVWQAHMRA